MHLNYSNLFGENYRDHEREKRRRIEEVENMGREDYEKKNVFHGNIVQSMHYADIYIHIVIRSDR